MANQPPATPVNTTGFTDWRAAFEERQAAKRALQASTAPCKCGHPKERHTRLKTGVYYQCRWYYGRGDGTCGCGLYRPRGGATARAQRGAEEDR